MEKKFDFKSLLHLLQIFLVIYVINGVLDQKNDLEQLKNYQNQIKQKVYEDNTAQSSVEVVNYKKIKGIVKDVVSKEVRMEMKRQQESLKAIHRAIVSSEETVVDKPSTTQSDTEITYKDKRLDAKVVKTADGDWMWNYKVNQQIKFDLIETEQKNGIMHFRVKATDQISGKALKVEDFQSKITVSAPKMKLYYGMDIGSQSLGISLGIQKGRYIIYGRVGSNGDKSVGVMRGWK